jgi:ADP-ribose pyrophosphatase
MTTDYRLRKLTDCKWLNLYEATYTDKTGRGNSWTVASRKGRPIADADKPDAVVIVPVIDTPTGKKLVVTREFRVPLWGYEYGFPAGLIEKGQTIEEVTVRELKEETGLDLVEVKHISSPIYSSAGMTDESACMVFVEAKGQISDKHLEDAERIEAALMDVDDIRRLLSCGKKISAKAWGLFYHYAQTGKIC